MPSEWDTDLFLNIWFTCIRVKLSCTVNPHTPIRVELVAKYFRKNMQQQAFIATF